MKLIEGLKKIKDLQWKAEDLRTKIGQHSAHLDYETPVYEDQKKQVREWLQAHNDILKEILHLRISIQRTNLATEVTVDLGKSVTKTIAEWIHRRRDLANEALQAWGKLTDRDLKEGRVQESTGAMKEVKIIRCYDPVERDKMVELYNSEPHLIDAKLEITNAVTDLIE